MSDTIFLSFVGGDAPRGGVIAAALRSAGLVVAGDLMPPEGTTRRDLYGETLADAWLVVPVWSPRALADPELVQDAATALARGAYLGLILDGASPPAALAAGPTIDLTGWSGARDRKLAAAIDQIVARARPAAAQAATAAPVFESKRRAIGSSRGAITAIVAAAVVALAVIAIVLTRGGTVDRKAEILTQLAAIPCSWLQVDPVNDGSTGTLALTGVADNPERAGETIRGLVRDEDPRPTVTIDRVARIGSADCPAIDVPRTLRRDDGGRLRVTSDGVGRDARMQLAEARVKLAFRPGDKSMALFGLEPNGQVTWVLPDYATLEQIRAEDVGFVKRGTGDYEFSLRADHLGWTGLLLVTGDKPLAGNLAQGAVRDSAAFADFLRKAAAGGTYQAEMVWYEIKPR